MMGRRIATSLLCIASLWLTGCASTQLQITVDIYDEDPRVELPMTPRKAQQLIANLQTLQAEAKRDQGVRTRLATQAVDIYSGAWRIVGRDDRQVEKLHRRLAAYTEQLATNQAQYDDIVNGAVSSLRAYVSRYQDEYAVIQNLTGPDACNQPEQKSWWRLALGSGNASADRGDECIQLRIRNNLRNAETRALDRTVDAISSFQTLGSTDVPFSVDWTGLEYNLNVAYLESRATGNTGRQQLLQDLAESIAQSIVSLSAQLSESGRSVPVNATRSPYTPSTLAGSSLVIANELETLRNDLPSSATSRTALASLVQGSSRFIELIDRLQDPGDPIWRVVTNPDNELHWNEESSETYFYAEGDAGVVIVRDDPLNYRVHSARNNPSALIQGQLEISRSLANAAISIAGAAGGLPTGALASSQGGQSNTAVETTPESFVADRAEVDAFNEQRKVTLLNLQRSLRELSTRVAEIDEDDEEKLKKLVASQARRFEAVLRGHRPLLDEPEGN